VSSIFVPLPGGDFRTFDPDQLTLLAVFTVFHERSDYQRDYRLYSAAGGVPVLHQFSHTPPYGHELWHVPTREEVLRLLGEADMLDQLREARPLWFEPYVDLDRQRDLSHQRPDAPLPESEWSRPVTVGGLRRLLDVSRATVGRMLKDGRLPHEREGRTIWIDLRRVSARLRDRLGSLQPDPGR
jgi:hypothetical protein